MINPIIAYYRFEHWQAAAATRMDCTASTGSHPVMEAARSNGKLWCYLCRTHHNIHSQRRHPCMALTLYGTKPNGTLGSRNLTSVYVDEATPNIGSGDIPTLQGGDAVIMRWVGVDPTTAAIEAGAVLELYILGGHAKQRAKIHQMAAAGQLDGYMQQIRAQATDV